MAVSISDIAGLKNKKVYETSNETIVLSKDFEKIIHSSEYKILGFLNGYMYSSSGAYVIKSTLDGESIAQLKLEVEHGSFFEGQTYFYLFNENTVYKVNQNLEIGWSKSFEDEIRSIAIDVRGSVYIVFKFSRDIRKLLDDGSELAYIDGSDDPTKNVKLFNCFVTNGGGWLYVVGTEYWDYDHKAQSFIDKYNTRTWEMVERQIINSGYNVDEDDPLYEYSKIYLAGDYFYIYGKQFVSKVNIKGIEFWKYTLGYNASANTFDDIGYIEYSDNPKTEYLYFAEDLYSSNGHSFGKLGLNGKCLWKITMTDSTDDINFKMCIYRNKIYITNKSYVQTKRGYILSLDDDRVLFRTRDGHLVEIVEYNENELYSPDNFYGMRLLADTIKDGIPKIVYHPLRHDDGDVINEDGDVLLLPEENHHYTDPENYDYKYLLCSDYRVDANDISVIFAKNYKPITTRLKNIIKTKQPYLPDRIHEFILSMPADRIDTMQDYDLIRSRYKYSYDKYLLADINMFFTEIITKDLGYTIITKKNGHEIVRKRREIYTYLLSKFDDISLIEEWLKENGVIDTSLPKYVDELRHHTMGMIQDIQMAGTPVQYDVQAYKQHEYTFDGWEYPNNTWGTQIFSCNNLPYDKRRCQNKIYMDSIANLVKRQEMRPVLFFLNGKAIKWSDCTIVRDWSYSYLVINNTDPYENDLSCILFPCDIRYGEDNDCLPESVCNTHFYFNENRELTTDRDNVALRVEVIDKNVVGGTHDYSNKYIEVENDYNQKASERNIFVFEDNKLFPDSRYYIQDHGKDIFTYLRPETRDSAIFKTFYWVKANPYYGTLYKVPNGSYVKDTVKNVAVGSVGNQKYVDNFKVPFDFKLYRNKTWSENIAQAVEYIMNYDMSLLIQYYKEESQMQSHVFSGQYLIDRVPSDGGWLIMPRHRKSGYDDYIMVFRNDHLYEYNKEIQYDNHNFKIPIFNHVNRDDTIEIVHFKMVDNSYYSLTVSPDKANYLPEGLRYDNFLLFGNSPSGKQIYDNFSVENSTQYDIDFIYRNNIEDDKYVDTSIKLKDDYYIGKKINICSKRQFQHMYYNIFDAKESINLSPDFRFCHDKSKYMIFLNWLIVPREEWDLNTMITESPKKYISITFNKQLVRGDRVEIFYLPMSFDEIDISKDINYDQWRINRDIQIRTDHLDYSFDKDLFMVSANNHKINYDAIENVDNHRFRLTRSVKDSSRDKAVPESSWPHSSTNTTSSSSFLHPKIRLYRFIQPDKLLSKLFSYSDIWSDAVDYLNINKYKTLIRKNKE